MEIIKKENPALVASLENNTGVGSLYRILKYLDAPDELYWALAHSVIKDGVWSWNEWEIVKRMYALLEDEGVPVDQQLKSNLKEALDIKREMGDNWDVGLYDGTLNDIREEVADIVYGLSDYMSRMFEEPYSAALSLDSAAMEFKKLAARIRELFPIE